MLGRRREAQRRRRLRRGAGTRTPAEAVPASPCRSRQSCSGPIFGPPSVPAGAAIATTGLLELLGPWQVQPCLHLVEVDVLQDDRVPVLVDEAPSTVVRCARVAASGLPQLEALHRGCSSESVLSCRVLRHGRSAPPLAFSTCLEHRALGCDLVSAAADRTCRLEQTAQGSDGDGTTAPKRLEVAARSQYYFQTSCGRSRRVARSAGTVERRGLKAPRRSMRGSPKPDRAV